jgi:tetratricopeptide (TPR) repeat protein
VAAGSLLALALCYLGEPDKAEAQSGQTLEWARSLQNPFDIACALVYAANAGLLLHRLPHAAALAEEAIAICETYGFSTWLLPGRACLACVRGGMGQVPEAIAGLEPVIEVWAREGQHRLAASLIGTLASFYAEAGRRDEARATIDRAIAEALAYDDRSHLSGLYMIRANILRTAKPPDLEAAAADLRQAVAVARDQGAIMLETAAIAVLRRIEARLSL